MPPAEAERRVERLETVPRVWDKFRLHQKICFLIGAKMRKFYFILDMGMGKTLLTLALIWYFRKIGIVKKKVLVIVPNNINRWEWMDEIEKHIPSLKGCVLTGTIPEKWEKVETTKLPLIISTMHAVMLMCCTKKEMKKSKKIKLKPDKKLVKIFASFVDGLVIDESTLIQGQGKLPNRLAKKIGQACQIIFELTGTPFGRDPTPIWTQMFLVDNGWSLGETLGLFRAAFFKTAPGWFGGFKHTFLKRQAPLLHRFLAHRSITYEADEGDLPRLVPIVKKVTLDHDAESYYERARTMMKEHRRDYRAMNNAFLRMRQISSGFIGVKDDETGAKAEVEFKPNRKLEMLRAVIEEIGPKHKFVIFHDFIFSGEIISRELDDMGIPHSRVWGGTKDSQEQLRQFKTNKKQQGFVVNSAAGARGLNLQVARYVIFFECPLMPDIRKQAIRRVRRQESEHDTTFVVDLVTKGTQDERILKFIAQGENLFDAIIRGRAGI